MPLAKTVPTKEATNAKETKLTAVSTEPQRVSQIDGIPIEIYRYFNIDPIKEGKNQQLETIVEWASRGEGSLGKILKKISALEVKLGQPKIGETRLSKMFNYIRLTDLVSKAKQQYKSKIQEITQKYKVDLLSRRQRLKEKIDEINKEIEFLKKEHRNWLLLNKNKTTQQIYQISQQFKDKIRELENIRKAYGGK